MIGHPYVTNHASLQTRFKAANERLWVDCGFIGCVQGNAPEHLGDLLASPVFGLLVWYGVQQHPGAAPISAVDLQRLLQLIESSGRTLPIFASCHDSSKPQLLTLSPYVSREYCDLGTGIDALKTDCYPIIGKNSRKMKMRT